MKNDALQSLILGTWNVQVIYCEGGWICDGAKLLSYDELKSELARLVALKFAVGINALLKTNQRNPIRFVFDKPSRYKGSVGREIKCLNVDFIDTIVRRTTFWDVEIWYLVVQYVENRSLVYADLQSNLYEKSHQIASQRLQQTNKRLGLK